MQESFVRTTYLQLVAEARQRIKETDVASVKERVDKGDRFYLVDVREDHEWEVGHLPGAIHIGKGVIERDVERLIPDETADIVLYCGSGYRSALAVDYLRRMGYTNAASMDGGIRGWMAAGFPVVQVEPGD
jgi:rhodanese-related sulfurtransferase